MKVYVATSWRNPYHKEAVDMLRSWGFDVYDFKESPDAFHWSSVDEKWREWDNNKFIIGLQHDVAVKGFTRDMKALRECDICFYIMPCGVSASLELGYAVGLRKFTVVYVPELREPDLMIRMANVITTSLDDAMIQCVSYSNGNW